MSIILGTVLLFILLLVGWIMILLFPQVFPPLVQIQQDTAGTEGLGGYGEFHLFILVFIVPLLFLGLSVMTVIIVGGMREEAHRGRI